MAFYYYHQIRFNSKLDKTEKVLSNYLSKYEIEQGDYVRPTLPFYYIHKII